MIFKYHLFSYDLFLSIMVIYNKIEIKKVNESLIDENGYEKRQIIINYILETNILWNDIEKLKYVNILHNLKMIGITKSMLFTSYN